MNCYYIIGLRVDHRHSNALNLQKTLTEFGLQHQAAGGPSTRQGRISALTTA